MATVYRVAGVNSVHYFNRKKDALACRPAGDQPEAFEAFDAAAECEVLHEGMECFERLAADLQHLLTELYDACPANVRQTTVGRRALERLRGLDPDAAEAMSPQAPTPSNS